VLAGDDGSNPYTPIYFLWEELNVVSLFEVMFVYLALGLVALFTAWAFIARRGFAGLEQTNSTLARFFRTRFAVVTGAGPETNTNLSEVVRAPAFASAVVVITMVISFSGKPGHRDGCQPLLEHEEARSHSRTFAIEAQIIEMQAVDANIY
jgi:hypothetical protein